jgi:signal peptidase
VRMLLKVLSGVLTGALLLVVIAAAGMLIASRLSADRVPTIKGHKLLTVVSGSMEPAIHTGDVIIVAPVDAKEVRVDDIITYRSRDKSDMLITHRVMGILTINGQPSFQTKGDANDSVDDGFVSADRLIGHMVFRVPYFGYLTNFVHKPLGFALFVVIPGLYIIIGEVLKMLKAVDAKKPDKTKADEQPAAPEQPKPPE